MSTLFFHHSQQRRTGREPRDPRDKQTDELYIDKFTVSLKI